MNREEMKDAWLDFLYDDIKERAKDAGVYKIDDGSNGTVSISLAGQDSETILFMRTATGIYVFFEFFIIYKHSYGYDYDVVNTKDLSNFDTEYNQIVFKEKLFEVTIPTKLTHDLEEAELKTGIQSWDKTFSAEFFKNLLKKCAKAQKHYKELIIKGAAESFQM